MEITSQDIYRIVFKEYPDVMDVRQISQLLDVSTKTVYKLICDGALSSFKIGREFRISKEFPRFMEKHGFRRLRFHNLRHSCASLLQQIQEWLGHSSFKITADAYAHLEYASKIAAANAMTWIDRTFMEKSPLPIGNTAAPMNRKAEDFQARLADTMTELIS